MSQLKLSRKCIGSEYEHIYAVALPDGYHFREIPYGFQILDEEPEVAGCEGEVRYNGETAYTVLLSGGQHMKSEIMIIDAGIDGDLKMLQKGSISFEDDQDLRWIEKIMNAHWGWNPGDSERTIDPPHITALFEALRKFDPRRPQREHSKLVMQLTDLKAPVDWPKDIFDLTAITRRLISQGV